MANTTPARRRLAAAIRVVQRVVVALAVGVAVLAIAVAVAGLRDRLISHPGEIPFWGYLSPGLFGVAWLVGYVGTRLNTRRDDSVSPAQGVIGPRQMRVIFAAACLAVIGFVYWVTIQGGRNGRGGLDEQFPYLDVAAGRGAFSVAGGCAVLWVGWALAPATFAYVQRRARAGLVDAVVDLGGEHSVRLLYRPTFTLGGPVTWSVNGEDPVTVSPGQAIGFLVPDGAFTATTATRRRARMVVRLDLAAGARTDIVLRRGVFPRVTVLQRPGEVEFREAKRAFASLWIGPGILAVPARSDDAMHVWASERPSGQPRRGPWWQSRWWLPVTSAVAGVVVAWSMLAAGLVRAPHGLGDELVAAVALPLVVAALSLDRARRALGWAPWRAPMVLILAALAGALAWWGAGWLTAVVVLLVGAPVALSVMMVRLRRSAGATAVTRPLSLPFPLLPHARIAFWKRQADAVISLSELAPDRPSSGYVRVVPVTPSFRGGVQVAVGGWSVTMTDSPVGVRLAAGTYPARVDLRRQISEVHTEVQPGHVTEVHVGLVPFGLQFARLRGSLSVRVQPAFHATLVVDEPPDA